VWRNAVEGTGTGEKAQGGKQHQGAVRLSLGGLQWLGSVGVVVTATVNLEVAVRKRGSRRLPRLGRRQKGVCSLVPGGKMGTRGTPK